MANLADSHVAEISRHSFFQGLPDSDLNVVSRIVRVSSFAAGSALFQQGDPAHSVYFIVDGQVELKARLPGGGDVSLTTLQAGDILGELALMKNHRRSVAAYADSVLTVLCMDSEDLAALCAHYHPASLEIMQRLAKTLAARIHATSYGAAQLHSVVDHKSEKDTTEKFMAGAEFDFRQFLPTLKFFKRFSTADTESLTNLCRVFTAPTGSTIREYESDNRDCHIVVRGAIQTFVESSAGSLRSEVLGPGELFGELEWLLDKAPVSMAVSLSRTTLMALPQECYDRLVDSNDHLSYRFHEGLVRSLLGKLDSQSRSYTRQAQAKLIGVKHWDRKLDRKTGDSSSG